MSVDMSEFCNCTPDYESCPICELEMGHVIRQFHVPAWDGTVVLLTWEVDQQGYSVFWGMSDSDWNSVQVGRDATSPQ